MAGQTNLNSRSANVPLGHLQNGNDLKELFGGMREEQLRHEIVRFVGIVLVCLVMVFWLL